MLKTCKTKIKVEVLKEEAIVVEVIIGAEVVKVTRVLAPLNMEVVTTRDIARIQREAIADHVDVAAVEAHGESCIYLLSTSCTFVCCNNS